MNKKFIMRNKNMKKEYDFSKGVRGKFYKKDANFHIPVYLEPEIESFFTKLANQKNTNLGEVINQLLFKDKEFIELAR